MTAGLLISSKTKNKLFSKKMKNPLPFNTSKFQTFNTIFNKCKRAATKLFYFTQFEQHKENIKYTWTLICAQTKKRENLQKKFKLNKYILNDPLDIANGFNDFFSGSGSQLAAEIQPPQDHINLISNSMTLFLNCLQFRKQQYCM